MTLMMAADIGGTFTDLVAYDTESGRLLLAKSLSTPDDFSRGILDCIAKTDAALSDVSSMKHGSTVAINTLLERTGARTALVTTRGFRDVLELRRGNRPTGLDLNFRSQPSLVERRHRYEVTERVGGRGEVVTALDEADVVALVQRLRDDAIESVAVCFINAYLNTDHEVRVGEILRSHGFHVTLSHDLTREWREYERSSTAVVNAYIAPRVAGYTERLERKLEERSFDGSLYIMQSNGGVIPVAIAKQKPVLLIESGPVAGVAGCASLADELGIKKVLSFDMGGTTAKCSLVEDAKPVIASLYWVDGYIKGYPVQAPVVDIYEVGTGGGSIAWIDEVGALKVGPKSASAAPGPVCYGLGGTQPTVTDANLVLGRLNPDYFLGGEMKLDVESARAAIGKLAQHFGLDALEMASGIVKLANISMSSAVRRMTVEKGHDPRDFVLIGTGGAGPLHVTDIATDLGVPRVIIPPRAGYFSAWGMLLTNLRIDEARTFVHPLESALQADFAGLIAQMEANAVEALRKQSTEVQSVSNQRFAEMRYVGQDHAVLVPLDFDPHAKDWKQQASLAFGNVYKQRYGHLFDWIPIEFVSLRLTAEGLIPRPDLRPMNDDEIIPEPPGERPVYYDEYREMRTVPVYRRTALRPGQIVEGPCVIEEYASTTILQPGNRGHIDRLGLLTVDI